MKIEQVAEFVNEAAAGIVGETAVLEQDLKNIVSFGEAVFNAGNDAVDSYVRALINRIGRTIFVDRKYRGKYASLLADGWEYGSVLMKVDMDLPEATTNETWQLAQGASYDPNVVNLPNVRAKFFNRKVTFEIDQTFGRLQVKQSFNGATEMMAFFAMIEQWIDNALTVRIESLARSVVNAMIGETVYSEYGTAQQSAASHTRAVNLLYLYKQAHSGSTLTAATCLQDPDFLRFAALTMGIYGERLASMSKLFNIEGRARFTPQDRLRVAMLADFAKSAEVYLYGNTYHDALVRLPEATDIVPFWQGSGTDYALASVSKVDVITPTNHNITVNGVLAVLYDRDAMMICNTDRRVTSQYNAKAEFTNQFYKYDADYFADTAENLVVFFVA